MQVLLSSLASQNGFFKNGISQQVPKTNFLHGEEFFKGSTANQLLHSSQILPPREGIGKATLSSQTDPTHLRLFKEVPISELVNCTNISPLCPYSHEGFCLKDSNYPM